MRFSRRTAPIVALLLLALAAAVIAGCTGRADSPGSAPSSGGTSGASETADATIVEKAISFEPSTLEVKVGDTVTFTNEDSVPHIVNIDGADLSTQNQGESVTWTASKAGTFPFTCSIHPSMTGEITVK